MVSSSLDILLLLCFAGYIFRHTDEQDSAPALRARDAHMRHLHSLTPQPGHRGLC